MNYYIETTFFSIKKLLSQSLYKGSVYTNSNKNFDDYKQIIFFFDYPRYMHLGDQLFFKPLMRKLKDRNNNTFVFPTTGIEFFFSKYIKKDIEEVNNSLFIARDDLLAYLRSRFNNIEYFLYNTSSLSIKEPISNYILRTFCDYYKLSNIELEIFDSDYLDFDLDSRDKFNLSFKENIIILNNYMDSGNFRVSSRRRKLLLDNIKNNKSYNDFVVHLGSQKDKEKDKNNYSNIVNLDLRGKTTLEDICFILSLRNIKTVYCHDTFIMHIANLYNQKICVVFKQYFKPSENLQKTIAFKSLFRKDCSNIQII